MDHQEATKQFYSLVWPHAQTVLRTARFLVRDAAEAEDLAQETLMKAFKAIGRLAAGSDVRAWLMTILRNTRIDRVRSRVSSAGNVSLEAEGVSEPADLTEPGDEGSSWESPQEILDALSDEHLIEALGRLPEEIRWTLLLVDVEGMEQQDAAAALGVPVGTIKSRAHRGRAMLRSALLPVARELRLVQ